jgi:hypothetical protein
LSAIQAARQQNLTVGCWQIYAIYPLQLERSLNRKFLDLLQSGAVSTVYPQDEVQAKKLLLIAPSAYLCSHRPQVFSWRVDTVEVVQAAESWQETSESAAITVRQLARSDFGT